jgi:hypothetical protein
VLKSTDTVLGRRAGSGLALFLALAVLAGEVGAADPGAIVEGQSPGAVEGAAGHASEQAPELAGSGFEIGWQTIDGGATFATGGDYQLRGTVGQVDADPEHPALGGDFAHTGGFWSMFLDTGGSVEVLIFRDGFEG